MPQYLMSVLHDDANGPVTANPAEAAAIDVFNEKLRADGNWVFAGGLASPSSATVVDARAGDPVFTDGPYIESKEYLVGFWIVEAPHLDAARYNLLEGADIAPGFTLTLDAAGKIYWFLIKDKTDPCGFSYISNQDGLIFVAQPIR